MGFGLFAILMGLLAMRDNGTFADYVIAVADVALACYFLYLGLRGL
jgi:hypothetical protein